MPPVQLLPQTLPVTSVWPRDRPRHLCSNQGILPLVYRDGQEDTPAGQDDHVAGPPEQGLGLTEPLGSQHSLGGGFSSSWQNDDNVTLDLNIPLITWYVVCEGRGDLDLEASDVPDSKSEYPAQSHQKPEMQTEIRDKMRMH